ncbi:MAG: hypothetical protein ACIAQU_05385 [Phycisphaerales bacterium JB064]
MSKSMFTKSMLTASLVLTIAGSTVLAQNSNGNTQQETKPAQPAMQPAQPGMPSFDEVAEKAVEFVGGREAIDKIKSLHTVIAMEFMGMEIKMDSKWHRDGGRLVHTETPQGNSDMGTDGKTSWMAFPAGPTGEQQYMLVEGSQAEQIDSQSSLHMNILDPKLVRKNMKSLEVVGKEEFAERMAYKVRFEPNEEEGYGFFYFDVSSGQPLGLQQTIGQEMSTITLSEWKTVDGLKFFHKMAMKSPSAPGGEVTMNVQKIEVNKVEDSAFELPEQVKELVADAEQDEEADNTGGDAAGNENGNSGEIKLEDLPEMYRERVKMTLQQLKSGGQEAINRSLPQFEQMLGSMPEGDDKLALQYIIQELKKGK